MTPAESWRHPHFTSRMDTLREVWEQLTKDGNEKEAEAVAWAVGSLMAATHFEAMFQNPNVMDDERMEVWKMRNCLNSRLLQDVGEVKRCVWY